MSDPKMYRLTVNGRPSCQSELTLGLPTGCTTHDHRWLERWRDMILKVHPEAVVEFLEGRCTFYETWSKR